MNRLVAKQATRQAAKRLGVYLRALRRDMGWTQSQAGEIIGVDSVTVRRWELGTFSPSEANIERLAEAYNVEVDKFLEAASAGAQDPLSPGLPINGYVYAGKTGSHSLDGTAAVAVPQFIVDGHPQAFGLMVGGDYLSADGVRHQDVLVVDPAGSPGTGSMCIVRIEDSLHLAVYITRSRLRLRTASGASEDVTPSEVVVVGSVVWHFRRM